MRVMQMTLNSASLASRSSEEGWESGRGQERGDCDEMQQTRADQMCECREGVASGCPFDREEAPPLLMLDLCRRARGPTLPHDL